MENEGKARCGDYPANTTFMPYNSSWEAAREEKPGAFPILCFTLTFKVSPFKMLIILSDISCVTEPVVAAEGEKLFSTTFLRAKEGRAKAEQGWAGGKHAWCILMRETRRACSKTNLPCCTGRTFPDPQQGAAPAASFTLLLGQALNTSSRGWEHSGTCKSTRKKGVITLEPHPSSELPHCSSTVTPNR